MSRKKAVLKNKPLLVNNLLSSSDIEIRLFSDYTCANCVINNSGYFIECDFSGYQRNLLDPNHWTNDIEDPYSASSYYSPLLYNNFSSDQVLVKGYYAVSQTTGELLFYSEFSEIMSLNSYDSFSLELFFSIDKYFYKNPKLLNLTININNSNYLYINNALLDINSIKYNGSSCDECIKDILGLNGNFYNNSYFLSINQNIVSFGGGLAITPELTFSISIIAPGFIDYNEDVVLSLSQNEYTINVDMVEQ